MFLYNLNHSTCDVTSVNDLEEHNTNKTNSVLCSNFKNSCLYFISLKFIICHCVPIYFKFRYII